MIVNLSNFILVLNLVWTKIQSVSVKKLTAQRDSD